MHACHVGTCFDLLPCRRTLTGQCHLAALSPYVASPARLPDERPSVAMAPKPVVGASCTGGLHTSAWIPPLLGAYYASAGGLLIAADSLLDGRSQNGARLQVAPGDSGSLASVALSFGCAC